MGVGTYLEQYAMLTDLLFLPVSVLCISFFCLVLSALDWLLSS